MTISVAARPRAVAIIAAIAETGVIGRDNDLPWRLSDDLRRFKRLTLGHPVIMGRRTYESMGRPLPGRQNVVLSSRADFSPEGVEVCHSLGEALAAVADADIAFILGGRGVFEAALPVADLLYLTRVHAAVEGDVYFPEFNPADWRLDSSQRYEADERNEFDYSFENYARVTAPGIG